MGHTAEGVLRRLLDEPDGVASTDREHAAECATCAAALTRMRADADAVASLFGPVPDVADGDVDAAWARLNEGAAADHTTRPVAFPVPSGGSGTPLRGRWRGVRRPAVAAVAAVAVLTGAGAAAANGWLPIFRAEKVAPVAVSTKDLLALPDLRAFGDVTSLTEPDVHAVADAAQAAKETGLDVPQVTDLPRGVRGEPSYQVGSKVEGVFTFRADRARTAIGRDLPPLPAGVDGAQVRLSAGPGVAGVWSSNAGLPALVVGRAKAPTAESSGVEFTVLRDYLLSLPGLPADLASQLKSFTADGTTLPLPFPADKVTSSTADVDGVQATVLRTKDKSMAAVVWVGDGVVTAVAGSSDPDELLAVARGLQ